MRVNGLLAAGVLSAVGLLLLSSTGYGVKARDGYMNQTDPSPTIRVQTLDTPDLTDGLLAYWPMEDGYGSTVTDWSGNGNHGTFDIPTLPIWQPRAGHIEGALLFDGQGGHVVCPASPSTRCGVIPLTIHPARSYNNATSGDAGRKRHPKLPTNPAGLKIHQRLFSFFRFFLLADQQIWYK